MIFVTVGTSFGFDRLIRAVDQAVEEGDPEALRQARRLRGRRDEAQGQVRQQGLRLRGEAGLPRAGRQQEHLPQVAPRAVAATAAPPPLRLFPCPPPQSLPQLPLQHMLVIT